MFTLFNTSQYFAGSSETLEILKRQKKENKKTKRQKQKKTVLQSSLQITEEVTQ